MVLDPPETPDLQEALHRTRTDDPFLTMEGTSSNLVNARPENRPSDSDSDDQAGPGDPAGDKPNAPKTPQEALAQGATHLQAAMGELDTAARWFTRSGRPGFAGSCAAARRALEHTNSLVVGILRGPGA